MSIMGFMKDFAKISKMVIYPETYQNLRKNKNFVRLYRYSVMEIGLPNKKWSSKQLNISLLPSIRSLQSKVKIKSKLNNPKVWSNSWKLSTISSPILKNRKLQIWSYFAKWRQFFNLGAILRASTENVNLK